MRNSRFQITLFAALLFCFVFPLALAKPAAAYTSTYALSTPTVQPGSKDVSLGTLYISVTGSSVKDGDALSISLPTCVELNTFTITFPTTSSAVTSTVTVSVYGADRQFTAASGGVSSPIMDYGTTTDKLGGTATFGIKVQVANDNRFTFIIAGSPTSAATAYYIAFPDVNIKPLGPEDPQTITATLDTPPGSGFSVPSTAPVLANVTVGGTTASVNAPYSATDGQPIVPVLGDTGGDIASIIIKENVPGSLQAKTGTVQLALPPGFAWRQDSVSVTGDWGFTGTDYIDKSFDADASGLSILSLVIKKSTTDITGAGRITVVASIDVEEGVAQVGSVIVNYQGTNPGVNSASLTVAKYATAGAATTQNTSTSVVAGRKDQRIGQFSVQEQTPGDLATNRTITLTLPSGAKWHTPPTPVNEAGNGELVFLSLSSDGDIARYKLTKASSAASSFNFKYGSVDLSLQVGDTLDITIGGSGNITGAVTVASVIWPVTLTANKTEVKAGVTNQSLDDFTIKENSVGSLRAKTAANEQAELTLQLPSGVTFSERPTVAVTDGNLNLDASRVSLSPDSRTLIIPISQSSTAPSTIKISGVQVDVDRTIPDGDIEIAIAGAAIAETSDIFSGSGNKKSVVVAYSGAATAQNATAVFTVDKAAYVLNGQEVAMDAAPYIRDGRTMIPLRFAANSVGITDSNIIWDGTTGSVTLIKGGRVVQMMIGSNALQINGTPVAIDVPPEISSERTMVPIRALGVALGASLQWDEADRTVTITVSQ